MLCGIKAGDAVNIKRIIKNLSSEGDESNGNGEVCIKSTRKSRKAWG
jgi:hypothetical protein